MTGDILRFFFNDAIRSIKICNRIHIPINVLHCFGIEFLIKMSKKKAKDFYSIYRFLS